MGNLSRRQLIGASLAAAAGAALAQPNVAKAGTTIRIWWNQGYYPAEDQAFHDLVSAWEKASGNATKVTMLPAHALNQKIISALTSGQVPDLIYSDNGPEQIIPQNAWHGRLLDLSDVVETQKGQYSKTALQSAEFYDNTQKKRGYFGVPLKGATLNLPMWGSLVEKAGFKLTDIPKTWDKFFAFFEPVQDELRKKGMRHTYALGYTLSTTGDDPNNTFHQFLVAYGGQGIVTPDGKLHADDPKVRKAAADALHALTDPFKKGYVPPSALNWRDPDNNNAFHAREVVITPNDTISISDAVMNNKKWYYEEIVTHQLPLDNDGKQVAALLDVELAFIPKGAKNPEAAKDFLRYLIQPDHLDGYLKQALGRWLPVMPEMVKKDPYWLDPKDPHRPPAVRQGVLGETATWFYVFNPAYAQVNAEHVWEIAESECINGSDPDKAAAKALRRIQDIFSNYQIT